MSRSKPRSPKSPPRAIEQIERIMSEWAGSYLLIYRQPGLDDYEVAHGPNFESALGLAVQAEELVREKDEVDRGAD